MNARRHTAPDDTVDVFAEALWRSRTLATRRWATVPEVEREKWRHKAAVGINKAAAIVAERKGKADALRA